MTSVNGPGIVLEAEQQGRPAVTETELVPGDCLRGCSSTAPLAARIHRPQSWVRCGPSTGRQADDGERLREQCVVRIQERLLTLPRYWSCRVLRLSNGVTDHPCLSAAESVPAGISMLFQGGSKTLPKHRNTSRTSTDALRASTQNIFVFVTSPYI